MLAEVVLVSNVVGGVVPETLLPEVSDVAKAPVDALLPNSVIGVGTMSV